MNWQGCKRGVSTTDRLDERFENIKLLYTPANPFSTQSQH